MKPEPAAPAAPTAGTFGGLDKNVVYAGGALLVLVLLVLAFAK